MSDKQIIDDGANAIQAAIVAEEANATSIENEALRNDAVETLARVHEFALDEFNGFKARHPELTEGVALRHGGDKEGDGGQPTDPPADPEPVEG